MAQEPESEALLFPKLCKRYRLEHRAALPRHYVDKSHPNLWLAEKLAREFQEARFIAIKRQLEGTVASMLKHSAVRRWSELWDLDPRPNRFLGVTESLLADYARMGIAARCAVRVVAHSREIERLADQLGSRFHVVQYEEAFEHPHREFDRISTFLGVNTPDSLPMPNDVSRDKWMTQLTERDRAEIAEVANMLGAAAYRDPRA